MPKELDELESLLTPKGPAPDQSGGDEIDALTQAADTEDKQADSAAADKEFSIPEYVHAQGISNEAVDFGAKVAQKRSLLSRQQSKVSKLGEFAKGTLEEIGKTGEDIWHAFPGTGEWDGQPKSGFGQFVQGVASAVTTAGEQIATTPKSAAYKPSLDPDGKQTGTEMESQDEYLKRIGEKIAKFDKLALDDERQRQAYVEETGSNKGWVSTIKPEDTITPEDRAEYQHWAAMAEKTGGTLNLGAFRGGETAIKAYRWIKGGEDKFTLDDWKNRVREDASLTATSHDLAQGKFDPGTAFAPPVNEANRAQLVKEGALDPQEVEKASVIADPTNIALMEGLRLPVFNKAVGGGLKLSGKAMQYVGGLVDHAVGSKGLAGKFAKGGAAVGGAYAVERAVHGDFSPIGAAVGLLGARLILTRGGRLAAEAGGELLNPEAFNSTAALSAATKGAEGGGATGALSQAASNFVNPADNIAAASRIGRRVVQGVGTGAVGGVPFAALAENPEEAGKAVGGGVGFGALAGAGGGATENPTLNRAMEINKAATRLLADRGAAIKFSDPALQAAHDKAAGDLDYTSRTYLDALKGLLSGFKSRSGDNMNIAILETPDYASRVSSLSGADPAAVGTSHGFFDSVTGTVYVNKGNFRVDSAAHEAGHFLTSDVMRQVGKAYGDALRGAAENGLFTDGKPTPEFQKFIDAYNAKTPGQPIPSDRNAGPDDILRHRAVNEYLAETTRAILGEPHVGRYTLPKDVSDRLADSLVSMLGDKATGKGVKAKGEQPFRRTDLPTINKAVKSALFDLGSGLRPDPSVTEAATPNTPPDASGPTPVAPPPAPAPESAPAAPAPSSGGGALEEPAPTGTVPNPAAAAFAEPEAAPTATATQNPAKANNPLADIGIDEALADSVRDYHINFPGMEPRTQRANTKRKIPGKSADRVAEELGKEWDDAFSKYTEYLRANDLQAPTNPTQLHQDVMGFYLRSDAGARSDLAETHAPDAGALEEDASSIETKSEDSPALAEPEEQERGGSVATEQEISRRVTDAENEAVQKPEFARKRTDVTRAEFRKKARVGALLDVADEHARGSGDDALLQRRTDPDGTNERFTGRLDPENIPAHRLLLQELGVQPDGEATIDLLDGKIGQTVYLDYGSAPKQKGAEDDLSGKQRAKELRASDTEDRRTGGETHEQKSKAFVPLSFKVWPGKGTVTLFGFSPDKWISNTAKLIEHLKAQGVEAGYSGVNDAQLLEDMRGYAENHANGFKGDGSGPVAGAEANGEPYRIPRNRFDVLNAALNFDISTKGGSKRENTRSGALEAQERAEANDWGIDPDTGDVNPLRAYVNKSGKLVTKDGTPGSAAALEGVYEHLAPDLVRGVSEEPGAAELVRPAGFEGDPGEAVKSGLPKREYAESGFMPDAGKFNAEANGFMPGSEAENKVRAASIRLKDGTIIDAPSHSFAYDKANEQGASLAGVEEGFTLRDGTFIHRDEAYRRFGGSTTEDFKPRRPVKQTISDEELLAALRGPSEKESEFLPETGEPKGALSESDSSIETKKKAADERKALFSADLKEQGKWLNAGAKKAGHESLEAWMEADPKAASDAMKQWREDHPRYLADGTQLFMPDSGKDLPRIKKGEKVSGLLVRGEIPNRSSIRSSMDNPVILPGVRELKVSDFTDGNSSVMRSKDTVDKVNRLAKEIKASGEINPLIVGIEPGTGAYILEGLHRIEALAKNGVETFPALVAVEKVEHGVSKSPYGDGKTPYFVHRMGTDKAISRHATPEEAWDAAETLDKNGGEFFPPTGKDTVESNGYKWGQSEARDQSGDKLVTVKVPELDAAWKKDHPDFYIGKGGTNGIGKRYEGFKDWRAKGEKIEAPFVHVTDKGVAAFNNGRHRFSVFRDEGADTLPVSMESDSLANAKKFGLIAEENPTSIKTKSGEFMPQGAETAGAVDPNDKKAAAKAWAKEGTESPWFKRWFRDSKVVDDSGQPLRVFSGHSNVELYGDAYDPKKGTAGAFYATESPEIASNYALGKIGIRESYENGSQYRIAGKNGKFSKKIWQIELTPEQVEKAREFFKDEDVAVGHDLEEYWKEHAPYGAEYRRRMWRGLKDLKSIHDQLEEWGYTIRQGERDDARNNGGERKPEFLSQGSSVFEDLMTHLGIKWNSYDLSQPGVQSLYLKIRNPLDASQPFPADLMTALKEVAKRERGKPFDPSEAWTKDYPLKQWVKDIEEGNEYWTTHIPKKALPIIKSFGYDGVKELGLKGETDRFKRQINWLAFDPGQIKVTSNRGTFNETQPNMNFMPHADGALAEGPRAPRVRIPAVRGALEDDDQNP